MIKPATATATAPALSPWILAFTISATNSMGFPTSPQSACAPDLTINDNWTSSSVSEPSSSIDFLFQKLARKWQETTGIYSIVSQRYSDPAYQAILAMGPSVIPSILKEIKERPDRWFAALQALTGSNPTKPEMTFQEGVDAWIEWGRSHGYAV